MSSFTKTLIVDKDSGQINTNHDFEMDTIWAKDANWTIDTTAKTATCTYSTGGADLKYDENLGFVDNEIYALQYTVDATTSGTFQLTSDGGVDTLPFGTVSLNTTEGTHEILLKCENSSHRLNLRWISDANSIILSDVSLKKHCENIQTAVTYLNSTGGSIIVEEGTYTITEAISVGHNDTSIIGRGAVKISSSANINAFSLVDKERVEISGLEFIMSYSGYTGSVIHADGARDCRFENLKISATSNTLGTGTGISFPSTNQVAKNNIVTNCLIEGCYKGIKTYEAQNNIFQSNTIRQYTPASGTSNSTTLYGIWLQNSDTSGRENGHNIVSGNVIDGMADAFAGDAPSGIYVHNSDYNILTGNITNDCGNMGIYVRSSEGTVISGNVSNNNKGDGIRVQGEYINPITYSAKYTAITGNTTANNGDNTKDLNEDNNDVEHNIHVGEYSRYNSIVGNTSHNGATYEISVNSSSNDNVVVGNNCTKPSGDAIVKGIIWVDNDTTDDAIASNLATIKIPD